jgi:hypothetical protein
VGGDPAAPQADEASFGLGELIDLLFGEQLPIECGLPSELDQGGQAETGFCDDTRSGHDGGLQRNAVGQDLRGPEHLQSRALQEGGAVG